MDEHQKSVYTVQSSSVILLHQS